MWRAGWWILMTSLLLGCAAQSDAGPPISPEAPRVASRYPAAADGTPFLPTLPPPDDPAAPADIALRHGLDLQRQAAALPRNGDFADIRRLTEPAARWFNLAAQKGSLEAWLHMGAAYRSTELQPPRPANLNSEAGRQWRVMVNAASLYWLRKAATQGSAEAAYRLGLAYGHDSTPCSESCPEELADTPYDLAGLAARSKSREAMEAWTQVRATCEAQGESWTRQAALMGDARAQLDLGELLDKRAFSSEQSARAAIYAESRDWFHKAAAQNSARAMTWIAGDYHFGRGVTRDDVLAVEWQRRAVAIEPLNPDLKTALAQYEQAAAARAESEAMIRAFSNMLKSAAAEQAREAAAFAALPPAQQQVVRMRQCRQSCETNYNNCRSSNNTNEALAGISTSPMAMGLHLGSIHNCGSVGVCQANCGG